MFLFNGGDFTIVDAGLIGAMVLFASQLVLCCKIKNLVVKLIPVYVIVAMGLFALATYAGACGTYSAGAISGNEIAGLVVGVVVGIAAIGELLAWLVYWIIKVYRRKNNTNG